MPSRFAAVNKDLSQLSKLFPKYTKKVTKFGLEVLTVKPCLFDLNLSIEPVKKFFVSEMQITLSLALLY